MPGGLTVLALVIAAGGTLAATPAAAWNCRGHEIVAAVAWQHITPAKRERVRALLALNPDAATWGQNAGAVDQPEAAFIQAACWADDIKSAAGYQDPPHGQPEPAHDPSAAYGDRLRHKSWHYRDIPFSPDHTPFHEPAGPSAETQIMAFRSELASPTLTDNEKSYALAWLLHLVGDVHQPLHATSRFVAGEPNGDAGGNGVCIGPKGDDGRCANLHAFWDDLFGRGRDPAGADQIAATLKPVPGEPIGDVVVDDWLSDSETTAERYAYATPIGPGAGPYSLDGNDPAAVQYRSDAVAVAKAQVELAGLRLAKLINDNLR